MSHPDEYKKYLVLKQENIRAVDELKDYDFFIVHHVSELSIYRREEFLDKYRNFDHIFNLYCIKPDEELRFNNGGWVKIFESNEEGPGAEKSMEAFNIEARDTKEYLPVQIKGNQQTPLVVYKY
ncbi:MAG: hypothetical protein QG657_5071, partial [Acidobacteriota bacterium]|nr:hypothetical protein [Acidobacteriota bacterium]